MERFGKPEEVAALVAWLASEDCSFSTGATFDLSGGRGDLLINWEVAHSGPPGCKVRLRFLGERICGPD